MPLKIALVSPYDFAHPGGVVNHILSLDKEFSRMGHDVRVIAPASEAPISPQVDGRFIQIGKPRSVPVSGSVARITLSLRLAKRIKPVLASEKFDIIHLHEPFIPMLCTAVLRFSNTVTVGTFHAFEGRPGYISTWPVFYYMMRLRNRKLNGHIAVSKPAYDYAKNHVPGKYTIIPNGIDLEHFNPQVPPIERFKDGKINILFVGRMERRKGLDYLLKAYEIIRKKNDNVRLIVVGPGMVLRRSYEKTVKKRAIPDVNFVGSVSYDELPMYYQTADIYCSPAIGRESFGIVLLEAMALGKPIVASHIEGYRHVVTDGQEGILVPPKKAKELAYALEQLIEDEETRQQMGKRGLETAAKYDWKIVAGRVLDFYKDTIANCKSKNNIKNAGAEG